jgi:hypothetical protein
VEGVDLANKFEHRALQLQTGVRCRESNDVT